MRFVTGRRRHGRRQTPARYSCSWAHSKESVASGPGSWGADEAADAGADEGADEGAEDGADEGGEMRPEIAQMRLGAGRHRRLRRRLRRRLLGAGLQLVCAGLHLLCAGLQQVGD